MDRQIIKLPDLPDEVSITPDWLATRAELLAETGRLTEVASPVDFDAAGELLRKITKTSNAMERFRKQFGEPFQEAVRAIKKAADAARDPLEAEKSRLQRLLNVYAAEQQRKAEEERRLIEAEQRKEIERQMAERAKAAEAAEALGLEDELPPPPVEVPAIRPQVERARADAVRVQESVEWEIDDEGAVPPVFKMVDPRRVNGWLAQNRETVKDALKNDPERSKQLVPGIRFSVQTKVISR